MHEHASRLKLMRISLGAWQPASSWWRRMSRLRGHLLIANMVGLVLACGDRPVPESELLRIAGASTLTGWRCKPQGARELRAGLRRGQWCIIEQRTPELLSATTLTRRADGQVMTVTRTWGATDSTLWTQLHDSVAAAINARTRAAQRCRNYLESPQDSARLGIRDKPYHLTADIWRLPDYDLVLSTSTPKPWATARLWSMNVEAYRYPLVVCGSRARPAA